MNDQANHPPGCGCCEGLAQRTPFPVTNRPGLSTLSYRVGTHAHFLESLLAGLARDSRMSRLRTREGDDPSIALCDAVATMLDVLAFYQERLLSETYLRTATETRSLHHLARQIAYVPAPAVAAATHLAFTVEAIPGGSDDIQITAGTRVQSVPAQDETPQTFETDQTLTARVAWNALRPRQTLVHPPNTGGADIYLGGVDTGLAAGDRLLFVGPKRRRNSASGQWLLATVRRVDPDSNHLRTHVVFDPPLFAPLATVGFDLYGLGQRAAIYGHNAVTWRTLPEATMKAYLGIPEDAGLMRGEPAAVCSGAGAVNRHSVVAPTTLFANARNASIDLKSAIFIGSEAPIDETAEWPDFTIFAPDPEQLRLPLALPPLCHEATLDDVYQAALEALTTSSKNSISQLIGAVPNTLIKQVEVLGRVGDLVQVTIETALPVLGGLSSEVKNSIATMGSSIEAGFEAISTAVGNLVVDPPPPIVDPLTAVVSDFADAIKTPIDGLKDAVTAFFESNPLSTLLARIATLTNGDPNANFHPISVELQKLGVQTKEAVDLLVNLPKEFQATVATQLMAAAVSIMVNFLKSQAGNIQLTPRNLAMGAMTAARLIELVLEYYDDDLTEWLKLIDPDLSAEKNPLLEILKGEDNFELTILMDLELAETEDEVGLFDTKDLIENLFDNFQRISPNLHAPLKAIKPLMDQLLKAGDDYLESGISRGARATRQYLSITLAKVLKPVEEPRPLRRPFPAPLTNQIDLERIYPEIFAGDDGWAILSADGTQRLYGVSAVKEAARSDYLLNAKTTRLTLDGPDLAEPFEDKVRQTVVYAGSRRLDVVEGPLTTPVAGDWIEMGAEKGGDGFALPRKVALTGEAAEGDEVQSEIAEVIEVASGGVGPIWYLAADLTHSYRRDSVAINANVGVASHGETQVEVLGNGDGALAFQTFTLKQAPLTHRPGQGERPFESTLEVRVNNIQWQAAPHLLDSGPEETAYTAAIDDADAVTLAFGDGHTGRRLPSGSNNVVARYRKGAGLAGNLRPRQLTTLASRPLGVRAVDNPTPASGGADGESLAELRRNLPEALLTFERIVSLGDFGAYAAAYPGIGKAHATWVWDGIRRRVYVSVLAADGSAIDVSAPLMGNLKASMDQVRDSQQPLTIASNPPVLFRLSGKLLVEPSHDFNGVARASHAAVSEAFSFTAARFAQGIRRSRVIAAIQAVAGVAAVDLDLLARADGLETASGDLPARGVGQRNGGLRPAELLVIDPQEIRFSRMTIHVN